jgi:hypothetical protein
MVSGTAADLRDLADQALEGQLADQQLRGLLVLADLAQRDGAGPVAVGLLYAACAHLRPQSALHFQLLSGCQLPDILLTQSKPTGARNLPAWQRSLVAAR